MKIACSSILKQKETLSDALEGIRALGFNYVDIVSVNDWIHFNPRDLSADFNATLSNVESLVAKNQLNLIAVNFKVTPEIYDQTEEGKLVREKETRAYMEMLKHFDLHVCSVVPCCWVAPEEWEQKIDDCCKSMAQQVAIAKEYDVDLCIELHVNSPVEKVEQAKYLLDHTPGLKVAFDPSHFYMQGYRYNDIEWILDHAGYVHMRDANDGKMQVPFEEGEVEFDKILYRLREIGYTGDFAIEFMQDEEHNYDEDALKMRDKILEYFPMAQI